MSDRIPPKLDNAPGYILRPIKGGWAVKWFARTDLISKGFKPRSFGICHIGIEPTLIEREYISRVCNDWQDHMLSFGKRCHRCRASSTAHGKASCIATRMTRIPPSTRTAIAHAATR